jgi:hypothetical protein
VTAPPELVGRVNKWVNDTVSVHRDFKTLRNTIERLIMEYDIAQAAYALPGLSVLAGMHEVTKPMVAHMQTIPRNKPSMDLELRRACGVSARAIAMGQLLPEVHPTFWSGPMVFSLEI